MICRLKIGCHWWDVLESSGMTDRYGHCNTEKMEIVLREDMPGTLWAETLLHEVLHACVCAAGLDMDSGDEEALVSGIAPQLLSTLLDNPALTKELVRRCKKEGQKNG